MSLVSCSPILVVLFILNAFLEEVHLSSQAWMCYFFHYWSMYTCARGHFYHCIVSSCFSVSFYSLNSSFMYAPNTPIQFLCVMGLFCSKDDLSEVNCPPQSRLWVCDSVLSVFILRWQQRPVSLWERDYIWRWDEGTSHCLVAWTNPCWHCENYPKLCH